MPTATDLADVAGVAVHTHTDTHPPATPLQLIEEWPEISLFCLKHDRRLTEVEIPEEWSLTIDGREYRLAQGYTVAGCQACFSHRAGKHRTVPVTADRVERFLTQYQRDIAHTLQDVLEPLRPAPADDIADLDERLWNAEQALGDLQETVGAQEGKR